MTEGVKQEEPVEEPVKATRAAGLGEYPEKWQHRDWVCLIESGGCGGQTYKAGRKCHHCKRDRFAKVYEDAAATQLAEGGEEDTQQDVLEPAPVEENAVFLSAPSTDDSHLP